MGGRGSLPSKPLQPDVETDAPTPSVHGLSLSLTRADHRAPESAGKSGCRQPGWREPRGGASVMLFTSSVRQRARTPQKPSAHACGRIQNFPTCLHHLTGQAARTILQEKHGSPRLCCTEGPPEATPGPLRSRGRTSPRANPRACEAAQRRCRVGTTGGGTAGVRGGDSGLAGRGQQAGGGRGVTAGVWAGPCQRDAGLCGEGRRASQEGGGEPGSREGNRALGETGLLGAPPLTPGHVAQHPGPRPSRSPPTT